MRTYTSILGVVVFALHSAYPASVMGTSSYESPGDGPRSEMIRNGSFEDTLTSDSWRASPYGLLSPERISGESRFAFGEESWRDYEFSVTFRVVPPKADGAVLIGVRHNGGGHYTVALGANGNQQHRLERAVPDPQTGRPSVALVQSVAGSIRFNGFHRLRVRCEGRRIRVWLNAHEYPPPIFPREKDELLFDVTDKDGPASGHVSVGSRGARVGFSKIKVAELGGKTLFEGVPALARHWWVIGNWTGVVGLGLHATPNGDRWLGIVTDYGGMGIAQKHLRVRKGDTCRGSLWMRGDDEGILVRLVDGKKTLAEQTLDWPPEEWKEFPLHLTPNADADDATLQILTTGGTGVYLDQISLVPDSARASAGSTPEGPQ